MKTEFSRIITYLRKSKGLSQKQVSNDLGISQALLSHYEKGIRECSLDFLVRIADYYDVSVDYILGRTSKPDGSKINETDIPDTEDLKDINQGKTDNYCLINRRIFNNSTGILYNILAQIGNKKLSRYVSGYLMTAEYNIFRIIHSMSNTEGNDNHSIPYNLAEDYCQAAMAHDLLKIKQIKESVENKINLDLSTEAIAEKFPESYDSLLNLLKNSEKSITQKFKL
jgi:transcriptional regulator with XRE-family HTH domain